MYSNQNSGGHNYNNYYWQHDIYILYYDIVDVKRQSTHAS